MAKLRNFSEFVSEKRSPMKKATLLKYKRKWEKGEEIPIAIENSLKAQGMIPRADGETRVSDEYKDAGEKMKDALSPKESTKKKIIKESFEDSIGESETTLVIDDRKGNTFEVKEIEGIGMVGESLTFAYLFRNGELTTLDKEKPTMKSSVYREIFDYLNDVRDNNESSAFDSVK